MSYTKVIKDEIVELKNTKSDIITMLSGFIRNNGYIDNNVLYLTTENVNIKNKIVTELINNYKINPEIEEKENKNFNKSITYVIKVKEKLDNILEDIGYLDSNGNYLDTPPEYIVETEEDIRAYLRGVFMTQGSINDPKTAQYHLEILINKPKEAIYVQKLLNDYDLNAKMLTRDKKYMIYIKDSEKISDFIKILGAVKAVLYYEDVKTYHDKKNHTNRLNNCEQANIDKIVASATVQLKNIEILEENLALTLLDDKTNEAVEYRKKYPEASLKELGEIITLETGNKITKSGIYHRIKKIETLANKIKN